MNDDGTVSPKMIGVYEYEYGGKKYKTSLKGTDRFPDKSILYFVKTHRKALPAHQLYLSKRSPWIGSFFIIGIICWILGFVLLIKYY